MPNPIVTKPHTKPAGYIAIRTMGVFLPLSFRAQFAWKNAHIMLKYHLVTRLMTSRIAQWRFGGKSTGVTKGIDSPKPGAPAYAMAGAGMFPRICDSGIQSLIASLRASSVDAR